MREGASSVSVSVSDECPGRGSCSECDRESVGGGQGIVPGEVGAGILTGERGGSRL